MVHRAALIAVVALACPVTACGGAARSDGKVAPQAETTVTLTLNSTPYGEHAPFYYGVQKGIYASLGIGLQIRPGSGSADTIRQVAQWRTDAGWADTAALVLGVSA